MRHLNRLLHRLISVAGTIGAVAVLSTGAAAQSPSQRTDRVAGRLIIQQRAGADAPRDEAVLKAAKVKVVKRIERLRISVLELPDQAIDAISDQLVRSGRFTFVEPDFTGRGAILPNDPSAASQWHLAKIGLPEAWNTSTGSVSVPIAIVDSGVDGTHPDLKAKITAGWNFLGANSDTSDVLGHGTAVAGVAGAATDNGIGVAGVSWNAPIMPLVVLNASDYAAYSDVANAIVYAADRGVRVINVSICGSAASSVLQSAIDYAWAKGALVFAAAGNGGTSALTYPAACNHAIAVSSTEKTDTRSSFSNFGDWITLAAPGNYILTTKRGGIYGTYYGTSFASPIAAAVAALVISVRPTLDRDAVLRILEQSTDDLGTAGFDTSFGWGRVNAQKAVAAAAALGTDTNAPVVVLASPAPSAIVSGTVSVTGSASDEVAVSRCDLYADNILIGTESAAFTFSWDSRTVANGEHLLAVRCVDPNSNVGESTVSVMVSNTLPTADVQAPQVAITSPASNAKVAGQTLISANATDDVGVSQLTIYIDGVQVYSTTSSSATYSWNAKKVKAGTHTITARAWDRAGNTSSASINVTR